MTGSKTERGLSDIEKTRERMIAGECRDKRERYETDINEPNRAEPSRAK